MPQGNQADFKSTNEIVERYAIVIEEWRWDYDELNDKDIKASTGERILGLYNNIKSIKSAMRWINKEHYLSTRTTKVKITIEEIENIEI